MADGPIILDYAGPGTHLCPIWVRVLGWVVVAVVALSALSATFLLTRIFFVEVLGW